MSRWLAVCALAGCRWGFESVPAGDASLGDGAGDALVDGRALTLCHASFDGPGYDQGNVISSASLAAAKLDLAAPLNVARLEVFTGEVDGTGTLGLWSHEPATNKPGLDLGTSPFTVTVSLGWQGADLAQPIAVAAGSTVWFMYRPAEGSQPSFEVVNAMSTHPAALVYRVSLDSGATWNGPFRGEWKLRIWCADPPP